MKQLKYHQQKLLKRVNLLEWKTTHTTREQHVISKYKLQDREEYQRYNRIVSMIRNLAECLARISDADATKAMVAKKLINKLYSLGIIENKKLIDCTKVNVSAFCERRLPMIMKRMRMVPNATDATRFIIHGHVRLGPSVVSDPSTIVSRAMEDFVAWVSDSKIKKKIDEFNDVEDDYVS